MVVLVGSLTATATKAYFSDEATSSTNLFSAGTLDLKVNDEDGPITMHFDASNIAPGYDSGYKIWCVKNVGTVPGQPYVTFSSITNNENGVAGPETSAEAQSYASTDGELGQYLKTVIGVGPCNWTVPSLLISQSDTGPQHPWGIPGLNFFGGNSYFKGPTGYKFPTLNNGDTYGFFMKVSLANDLQRWDGTKWIDVDDNIIQSDGASFDITFHLDQATP